MKCCCFETPKYLGYVTLRGFEPVSGVGKFGERGGNGGGNGGGNFASL